MLCSTRIGSTFIGAHIVWLESHPQSIACHPGRAPLGARAGIHVSRRQMTSKVGLRGSRIGSLKRAIRDDKFWLPRLLRLTTGTLVIIIRSLASLGFRNSCERASRVFASFRIGIRTAFAAVILPVLAAGPADALDKVR